MDKPLISVLVVCYNNQKFIYECLRSIFSQTYPNVEVLIGDDCSKDFDEEMLRSWISTNCTSNIKRTEIIHNDTNMGTVKNLENLQMQSKGEYLFNIAADDALYDMNVLDHFYDKAVELGDKAKIIVAETEMWDQDLRKYLCPFITPGIPEFIENNTPRTLFAACSYRIFLPASYLYHRKILSIVGNLSSQYRLVEDVPTHLRLLANGIKPYFMESSPALKHRDGGISHGNSIQSKLSFLYYCNDIMNLYVNEILPHMDLLTPREYAMIKKQYDDRVYLYHTKHVQNYLKSCKDKTEAYEILKEAELAGHLPPTDIEPPPKPAPPKPAPPKKMEVPPSVKISKMIKNVLFKFSRKQPILTSTFFTLMGLLVLCNLVAGSNNGGKYYLAYINEARYYLPYFVIACAIYTVAATVINLLLRIQFYISKIKRKNNYH